MTRLVKLSLKNFKSFKKAELPISKGFTAIVGSNGSGKSNVLDALLFVLGITSLKKLRAAKLTDLVYSNAKENYAKVTLSLKHNGKDYEISRMIDKLGKSVYRLDGKRTTLNEVSSLLLELGVDVTGHNIVTQGDITKIIEMSPIERRQIVDNIAGLSEFDQKKNEAVKELEKVDSRIKEATIILNERTTFLSELEQEMNAAKEYSGLEEERKKIKATVIWKELYSIEKRAKEINDEMKGLEKERDELEKENSKLREDLSKEKNNSNELSKKAVHASEEVYITIGREFEEKKSKLSIEQEKVEMKKLQIEKNQKKIEINEETNLQNKKEKKELDIAREKIEAEYKELMQTLKVIEEKKRSVEGVVDKKNQEIVQNETELDAINKDIDGKRKEIFDLEVFAKNWDKQKVFNTKKLSELESENESVENSLGAIQSKKEEISKARGGKNLQSELEKARKKVDSLFEEKSTNTAKIKQEQKAISELQKEISKCPICDSEIEKSKKEKLIIVKEKLIEEKKKEEKKLDTLVENAKKEYDFLQEKIMLVARLEAEISGEKELLEKAVEIKKKIKEIHEDLDEKKFEAQLDKQSKMDDAIKVLLHKREGLKEKLRILRSQNIFAEYSQATKAHEEMFNKKSAIDSEINEIKIKTGKIMLSEEGNSIENAELEKEIDEWSKVLAEREPKIEEMKEDVAKGEKELEKAQKKSSELLKEKEEVDKKIEKIEKNIYANSASIKKIESRINEFNIENSRIEVRQTDLEEEGKEFESVEKIKDKTVEEMKERLISVDKRLSEIGAVNLKAMDNFNDLKKEVDDIQEKSEKLSNERLAVLDMIDKIDVKRTNVFMECFNEINGNFQDMFSKFFNGEGDLSLSNPEDPLESGLLIDAQPKGGKLQNIDSMSGGEKTLTALAFMFAIQLYSPAPFYAFDEADAALDKENSMKMGGLIEKIAENSQFISVTHNDTITKKAAQIIGVALNKDNSSVIGLKLKTNN